MTTLNSLRDAALSAGNHFWRQAGSHTGAARAEVVRRAALARQTSPEGVKGPSLRLLLGEIGALSRRKLPAAPAVATRPQPVMLLPGFGAHPMRMRKMQRALEDAGHSAVDWGLGFNLGPTPENFAFLISRVASIARVSGAPVVLVGWSLGGLFAREIAKRRPEAVAKVITMGSPFSGDRRANNAWRAYQMVTGHTVDAPPVEADFAIKPTVPTIALWSPRDGIVSPRSASGWPGERDRAVALRCNHLGFASDPAAIAAVLYQIDIAD